MTAAGLINAWLTGLVPMLAFNIWALHRAGALNHEDPATRKRAYTLLLVSTLLWPSWLLIIAGMMFEPTRFRIWRYLRAW